jgi:hypothetical protein
VHIVVDSSIAARIVRDWPEYGDGVETLTRWCIANNIVYPDPTFNEQGTQFEGWQFADRSKIIFDDANMPHIIE